MGVLCNTPLAHAFQAYCWASKQGIEGAYDRVTRMTCMDTLSMIRRTDVSDHLTIAAGRSLCCIAERCGERRGAVR